MSAKFAGFSNSCKIGADQKCSNTFFPLHTYLMTYENLRFLDSPQDQTFWDFIDIHFQVT